jgi:Chaperone of endosialidase
MSIRIGNTSGTTSERLHLLTTQPDSVFIASCNISNIPTNIVFNNTSRLGNSNNTFYFSECNNPYLVFSSNAFVMYTDLTTSNIQAYGNAKITSNITADSFNAKNISTCNILASNVHSSFVDTSNVSFMNSNIITFNKQSNSNAMKIAADTTISGSLYLDYIHATTGYITNLVQGVTSLSAISLVASNNGPNMINISNSSNTDYTNNLLNVSIDNSPSFIINSMGYVGVNTDSPQANVHFVSPGATATSNNIFAVTSAANACNAFVIDPNANVGIGTTSNFTNPLTLYSSNGSAPIIGIYSSNTPIISATNNNVSALYVSQEGNVLIGNGVYDSRYALNVQGATTTTSLITNSFYAANTANPISFHAASLSNLTSVSTISILSSSASLASVTSVSTTSSNINVPGALLINSSSAKFTMPSVLYTSPQIVMGNQNDALNTATELGGTLFIRAPNVSSGQLSSALTIVGNDNGYNIVNLVAKQPALYIGSTLDSASLTVPTYKSGIGIDRAGFYISYTNTPSAQILNTQRQIQINSSFITLASSVQIATTNTASTSQGYMGVNLPNSSPPLHALHLDGGMWIQSSNVFPASATTAPLFCIDESTGNVGIRTNVPQRTLHVQGAIYAQSVETNLPVATASDAKLKKNLEPISDALEKVKALTGYTYTRRDTGTRETGLVAQDVQKILPEAVCESETLGVYYGNLAGLFVEAIKAMSDRITALENQLESLK